MNDSIVMAVLISAIFYGTPLLYAALGEVLAERSGVLNLGVEGMMLMGAVVGSVISSRLDAPGPIVLLVAFLAAMVAGALTALLHAFATITLRVNQTVSGLTLTILAGGAGLSSYLANVWQLKDPATHQFQRLNIGGLKDLPIVGPLLFDQTLLTYLSWVAVAVCSWYLFKTRTGLNLRSVGESPSTADAMGLNVVRTRYIHTMIGGAMAGIGGICFSLSIVPTWVDGMTAGRGWIALALVIFGFWRPLWVMVGAYLFGALSSLSLILQARGFAVPPELLDSLPYIMTVVVLVVVSAGWSSKTLSAPDALGTAFEREAR
ncbi:ABC transporter permease [Propioniciclava tarda]|uniref:ABC transporter permease n=1 Tax=Propioniciclava tarda TaxID=433330 RepID=A0A4Q9KNT7_PROTD|nr:ABC transporter permease [Propioniciclava tarda]TBT96233.1 ABC transporter permease [Propioniciclava tarda]SMO33989.1 nucleoside ABC transporter membrane protein [Propioniciclava tarda]